MCEEGFFYFQMVQKYHGVMPKHNSTAMQSTGLETISTETVERVSGEKELDAPIHYVSHMLHLHDNVFAKPVSIAGVTLDFLSSIFSIFSHFRISTFVMCRLKMCINADGKEPQMHTCLI